MAGITPVDELPDWVTLLRAPNPGPMTLEGTNTWILRADRAAYVVDPGPLDEGHLGTIAAYGPFVEILVTHGHHDHVEGAARLADLLGGTPVRGIAQRHTRDAAPLQSGERLTAGELAIEVLATPGHTADSVCFDVRHGAERVLLSGDTILGRGTAVVAWPDGDLGAYLTSLTVLSGFDGVQLLPGHGPVLPDCAEVARDYLQHRRERLAQVRAAVAAGAETPGDVVDRVYPDIDPVIRFAAEASAGAQLDYLRRESQAVLERLDPL